MKESLILCASSVSYKLCNSGFMCFYILRISWKHNANLKCCEKFELFYISCLKFSRKVAWNYLILKKINVILLLMDSE